MKLTDKLFTVTAVEATGSRLLSVEDMGKMANNTSYLTDMTWLSPDLFMSCAVSVKGE